MNSSIKIKKQEEKGNLYNIEVTIPMDYGFIEDMYINFL